MYRSVTASWILALKFPISFIISNQCLGFHCRGFGSLSTTVKNHRLIDGRDVYVFFSVVDTQCLCCIASGMEGLVSLTIFCLWSLTEGIYECTWYSCRSHHCRSHHCLLIQAGIRRQTYAQRILLLLIESGAIFCAIQLIYLLLVVQIEQPEFFGAVTTADFKAPIGSFPIALLMVIATVSSKIIHHLDPATTYFPWFLRPGILLQ